MGSKDWIKILLSEMIKQRTIWLMKIKNMNNKTRKQIIHVALYCEMHIRDQNQPT